MEGFYEININNGVIPKIYTFSQMYFFQNMTKHGAFFFNLASLALPTV